jgi:predicted MPP superfamily phosphohydrolase
MSYPKLIHSHNKYCEVVGNKNKNKIKEYYCYKNNNFFNLQNNKLVLMSDLHSLTDFVIDDLIKKKKIDSNTIVISTGDMCGNNKIGGNGDPYNTYKKILFHSCKFYFVQGNHDAHNDKCYELQNSDGSPCLVDSIIINTPIGKIAGINGIYVDDENINHKFHKYSNKEYNDKLKKIFDLNPDIILSHQPITNIDFTKYNVKYFICGHYKIEPFIQINNNISFINLDNKILVFE